VEASYACPYYKKNQVIKLCIIAQEISPKCYSKK